MKDTFAGSSFGRNATRFVLTRRAAQNFQPEFFCHIHHARDILLLLLAACSGGL